MHPFEIIFAALTDAEQTIQPAIAAKPATDTTPAIEAEPASVDIALLQQRLNHLRCVLQQQRLRLQKAVVHSATNGVGI